MVADGAEVHGDDMAELPKMRQGKNLEHQLAAGSRAARLAAACCWAAMLTIGLPYPRISLQCYRRGRQLAQAQNVTTHVDTARQGLLLGIGDSRG